MKIVDCRQRTPEWVAARLGRLTGTGAADMLSTRKDKTEAAGRRNLRVRLALERIVGRSLENGYVSAAMQNGIDREADALGWYEVLSGRVFSTAGFIEHDSLLAGCSLDGYVGDFERIIEAKCPLPATHLEYLRTGVIPGEYEKQILHNLWITGASICDWLSYCPEFPEPLQVKMVTVERTAFDVMSYGRVAAAFLEEVADEVAAIHLLMQVSA